MGATVTQVYKTFWTVRDGRKYLGVIRFKDGLYVPWFEARQIGEAQPTLEDAINVLASA